MFAHTCSSLPASGTFAWDPSVGACLLTSPEVTCRALTHSLPQLVPTPAQSPHPLGQGEGTGPPAWGVWIPRPGALGVAPAWLVGSCLSLSPPLEACGCSSQLHTQTWERQLISVMRFPPLLRGFCLINLWNSSPSHPQTCPAGREFTSWWGKLRQGARLQPPATPTGHSCLPKFPGPDFLPQACKGPGSS